MDKSLDISRLSNARLLAIYAMLLHVLFQSIQGYADVRLAPSASDTDAASFAVYCITGQPPSGIGADEKAPNSGRCVACHVHCATVTLASNAFAVPVRYALRWIAPSMASVEQAIAPGLYALSCRGPPGLR